MGKVGHINDVNNVSSNSFQNLLSGLADDTVRYLKNDNTGVEWLNSWQSSADDICVHFLKNLQMNNKLFEEKLFIKLSGQCSKFFLSKICCQF
jgi:hypothetical protein